MSTSASGQSVSSRCGSIPTLAPWKHRSNSCVSRRGAARHSRAARRLVRDVADGLPLGSNRSWGIAAGGEEFVKGKWQDGFIRVATDGFVDAMGMTHRRGTRLQPQDVTKGEPVVVINQTAAQSLWPGQNALGKLMRVGGTDRRVIGVVRDVRHLTLEQEAGQRDLSPAPADLRLLVAHADRAHEIEPAALAKTLRTTLAPIVPNLPTNEVETLQDVVDDRSRRAASSRHCSADSRCSRCVSRCSGSTA